MTDTVTQYACDACHSRKIKCSRDRSGCERCKAEDIACSYSRSGVIRRSKKQKGNDGLPARTFTAPTSKEHSDSRQSQPDNTDRTAHERLRRLAGKDHQSLKALASLLEEYAAAWQGSSAFEKLVEGAHVDFYLFQEDQIRVWMDEFNLYLQEENLLLVSAPSEVLDHLAASRPHQIRDRAWLVMFYSIALTVTSSNDSSDESTKAKLRSNLWLALNDARLLLEPSPSSAQALVILASHAEEYMTPSLCWSLITKACVMMQALGFSHWSLDSATRDRRAMFFWRLNTLDKSLALILCRPPIFHREMTTTITLPTLDQLLPSPAHAHCRCGPRLFNAHFKHQMHLLSRVMADVWHCLYGQDSSSMPAIIENLEQWYSQATELLDAAALTERPLLTKSDAASVEVAQLTLDFHYYYLLILLMVSSKLLRTQCTVPSRQMLKLLPRLGEMMLESKEPYACLLWQRLHCPVAAFGSLWGEIIVKGKAQMEHTRQSLEAIETLPPFLAKLGSRNSIAMKLESITIRIIEQAKSMLYSQNEGDQQTPNAYHERLDLRPSDEGNLGQCSNQPAALLSPAPSMNAFQPLSGENFDAHTPGQSSWPEACFFDSTFDWFAWDNQESS